MPGLRQPRASAESSIRRAVAWGVLPNAECSSWSSLHSQTDWGAFCRIPRGSQEDREGGGTGEEFSRDKEKREALLEGMEVRTPSAARFLLEGLFRPWESVLQAAGHRQGHWPAGSLLGADAESRWKERVWGAVCLLPSCEIQWGQVVREGADGTPILDTCRCPQEASASVRPGLGLSMRSVGQNHVLGLFASSGTRKGNSLLKARLLGGQGGWVSGPGATWGGELQIARQCPPSGRIAVRLEAPEESSESPPGVIHPCCPGGVQPGGGPLERDSAEAEDWCFRALRAGYMWIGPHVQCWKFCFVSQMVV